MKLKSTVIAMALAFPLLASAQSAAQLQQEVNDLKAQVKALQDMVQGKMATAPAPAEAAPQVDLEDFNRIKTKVEAAEDTSLINGMKGLRISGGIDPTYIYNDAKGISTFSFANSSYSGYDNSFFGVPYLDIQKEMEGGTKMRLTLTPAKTLAGTVSEASASIPLTDAQTRLMVGMMPDVSGYEAQYNTFAGANAITSNQLYPSYPSNFITHNLLFDFTSISTYTGAGLDLVSGPWEQKFFVANANSQRNDTSTAYATQPCVLSATVTSCAVAPTVTGQPAVNTTPAFIYYVGYYQDEYWGLESTLYFLPSMPTPTGGAGRVTQFEIDGNYTRGVWNTNLQFVAGQQAGGAFVTNGNGLPQDSTWYGLSALVSRTAGSWIFAGRADYLANSSNGGGIFTLADGSLTNPLPANVGACLAQIGDVASGFGPDQADPTCQTGSNRAALSFATTYRLNANVALRGEVRRDFSTTSSFYNWNTGNYQSTNNVVGMSAIVNF